MKSGSWDRDKVTSSRGASRFPLPRAVSLGCGLTVSPSRAIKGKVEPLFFFWLCVLGRSGWAWLNPQVRKGTNPSPSVLALSCARAWQPREHRLCARALGAHPPLWRSLGSVFPELTELCFPAKPPLLGALCAATRLKCW